MLIFNTTYHVDDDICDVYVDFMKNSYVPQATESGFLHSPCFTKIHPQHEQDGVSYSLQFKVKNIDTLNYWLGGGGKLLHQEFVNKFGNKAPGFITIMEEIEL